MSAAREQNDSDGSWTWVDNEDDAIRRRVEVEEVALPQQVDDVAAGDSDVSVLTDPEDHPAAADAVPEGTPLGGAGELEEAQQHFASLAAQMRAAAAAKAALDVARPGECELAVTERRARAYLRSTFASAAVMLGGLLIAGYCQWGCDDNYSSPVQEYYNRPYDAVDVDELVVEAAGRFGGSRQRGDTRRDQLKYAAQAHKNAREKYEGERRAEGKRHQHHDDDDDDELRPKKQKKGESKHKKVKHEMKRDEEKENERTKPREKELKKKHQKQDQQKEHAEYLSKKEAYLKQKEGKLKQKEYKLYAKDASTEKHDKRHKKRKFGKQNESASGDWYDNLHKGRKDKRKQGEQADWMFERAQARDKKRDKAHWYFDMMDERQTSRVKKT